MKFSGSFVALVTPFRDGEVDEAKLRELVDFQIANKTSGIIPCGTTGESATLSYEEHHRVVEVVIDQVRGRVPVIAGTGSNSTHEAIELTRHAAEAGADACLIVVPYYNKPTQKGLIEHYSALVRAVDIPLIVYNIPGRTGINMLPSTIVELARRFKNIVGVKESTGNLDQTTELAAALQDRKDFSILSGDDSLTLPILAAGGTGVISVLANLAPRTTADLCAAFLRGDLRKAQALHWRMYPLIKAMFLESNPAPVKTAMEMVGLCSSEMRLPMTAVTPETRKKILQALKDYGVKVKPS
jgi:4-hydroxy-tetrahydrodipicolinate synthase